MPSDAPGRSGKKTIALGILAALVIGVVLFALWEVYAPGDPPEFQIAGCYFVALHESFKRDAGVGYRDYDLACIVKGFAAAPPCDEVMARYLSAKGPLPKDVNVIVRGEDNGTPDICRSRYHGDGSR